jgi:hypothetical protein
VALTDDSTPQSTWHEAWRALGLTRWQTVSVSVAKLVLWHWSQPLAYLFVFRVYYCELQPVQIAFGQVVAAREVIYLATTVAGVLVCPAYLLLDLTTLLKQDDAKTTAAKIFRTAVYILTPHNYVALCVAAHFSNRGRPRQPRHRKKMVAFGCLACWCAVPVMMIWTLALVSCRPFLVTCKWDVGGVKEAAKMAWWPVLFGLFLLAVVRRRASHLVAAAIPVLGQAQGAGFLARAFHGLAVVQIAADFCSCFALGKLLEQATIGTAVFKTGALCWGYGITAFGFLLVWSQAHNPTTPASVVFCSTAPLACSLVFTIVIVCIAVATTLSC